MLMINYNKLMKKLDDKGITTYVIRQKGLMPQSTLTKIKMCSGDSMKEIEQKIKEYNEKPDNVEKGRIFAGGDVSTKTIEDICQLLQCQPQDIIDWEVELNPELSYENRYKNAK
jgi:DNA-binding Xre family transcriptional regulator